MTKRRIRLPVAPEGWPVVLVPAGAALVLSFAGWRGAGAVLWVAAVACVGFFRDPERTPPDRPGVVVAPADGRVMDVQTVHDGVAGEGVRVSIFLSPLDVHVNRAPIGGLVTEVEHRPGRFLAAYRAEASEANERCSVRLQGEAGPVSVRQIAGTLARRIVCRVRPGDQLALGERFGLIRFGSRTDVLMPRGVDVRVRVGDRVRGGETVIGEFS
ncbi:MAG: phosphatidylserine decarboxylase family protein [Candidatus Methylomirabilia bacterium]